MSLSPEERHKKLLEMLDEAIDYSDIPVRDEAFFKHSKLVMMEKSASPFD